MNMFKSIIAIALLSVLSIFTNLNIWAAQTKQPLDTLIAQGKALASVNPDSSIKILNNALCIALSQKKLLETAEVFRRLGVAYHYKHDYTKSQENNFESLKIRQVLALENNDSLNNSEIALLYYNIALNYKYMEQLDLAVKHALKVEPFYIKNNDLKNLAYMCYDLVASLYHSIGEQTKAQKYAYRELEIWEKLNDTINISYTKDFIASILERRQLYSEALQLQLESLQLRKLLNDSTMLAYSYNNIGTSFLRLEHYDSALVYFNKSLTIKKHLDNEDKYSATLNNIGLIYQKIGKPQIAIKYYKKAYEYGKKYLNWYEIASSSLNLGVAYEELSNPQKTEQSYMNALNIAKRNHYKNLIVSTYEHLAQYYSKNNKPRQAYESLRQKETYMDSLRNADFIRQITKVETEYELKKIQIADSIQYVQESLKNEAIHQTEIRHKEFIIWTIISSSIAIITIIIILFRLYQIRKENAENALKHKALETERNLLRTQMNPHFIFNAMNSIQYFITQNDSYNAERFLSKFARLIRMILDNSTRQYITLNDELASLSLYLDLEKLRFNDRFSYEITADDDIEDELIAVPPMLIQPFVENSILHGLMNKTNGHGLIRVIIAEDKEQPNTLICTITDNGIGRKKATKIKEEQGSTHRSVGMHLTRKRLYELNAKIQSNFVYHVDDLYNNYGEATGTQVIIRIPYTYTKNINHD